jgi:hypothetical protein
LLRAEKFVKKARKANLLGQGKPARRTSKSAVAKQLFALTQTAQAQGWSAEELLSDEIKRTDMALRKRERSTAPRT